MDLKSKNRIDEFIKVIFLLIIAIAAILRIIGIGWGMPYAYHPDERLLVARSIYFFSGDLNPHLFIYPSLQMYITFLANSVIFGIGHITGHYPSVQYFTSLYQSDPTIFYLVGRFVVVIFALLSIVVTYFLSRRVFGISVALISSFLLSILPVHILHSHYVTTDVPCILFVLLSFNYSLRILDEDQWQNYLMAGIFAGLAASIKYNGGTIALIIVFAHIIKVWQKNKIKPLLRSFIILKSILSKVIIISMTASILTYLLTSPYTIIDFQAFLKDFLFQVAVQRRGHGLIFLGIDNKILYPILTNFRFWGGVPIWLFMMASLVNFIIRINKYRLLFVAWIGLYYLALVSSNDLFIRYTLLLTPFMMILVADLINGLLRHKSRLARYVTMPIFIIAILYMSIYALLVVKPLAQPDVRTTAKQWFEDNAQDSTVVGIMTSSTGMVNRDDPPIDENKYAVLKNKSLRALMESSPEWLIISSYDEVDFLRLGNQFDFTRDNYSSLMKLKTQQSGYSKVKEFNHLPRCCHHNFLGKFPIHDMMYSFPIITFYRKNLHER